MVSADYCLRTDSFSSIPVGDLLKCNSIEVREAMKEIVNSTTTSKGKSRITYRSTEIVYTCRDLYKPCCSIGSFNVVVFLFPLFVKLSFYMSMFPYIQLTVYFLYIIYMFLKKMK